MGKHYDYDAIAEKAREGWLVKDICAHFGCCAETVKSARDAAGIETERERISREVRELAKDPTLTSREIADKVGCDVSTAGRVRAKMGHQRHVINTDEILGLVKKGVPDADVARKVGCSAGYVAKIRQGAGIKHKGFGLSVVPKELQDRVAKDIRDGKSILSVSRKHKLGKHLCYQIRDKILGKPEKRDSYSNWFDLPPWERMQRFVNATRWESPMSGGYEERSLPR